MSDLVIVALVSVLAGFAAAFLIPYVYFTFLERRIRRGNN